MKLPLFPLGALLLGLASAQAEKLTLQDAFGPVTLSGRAPRGVALSPDGARVTYLRAKDDDPLVLDLWAIDVAGGEPYRLIDSRQISSGTKELGEAEKALRQRKRISARGIVSYAWDDKGRFILVPVDGDVFLYDVAAATVRAFPATPGDEIDAKVSPLGHYVSYVRDQNLYVRALESGDEKAVTTEGRGPLSFATAEFVAQEEMHRFTGYWWSPDERRIALTRVDESPVDVITRVDLGAQGATLVPQRYPRAGRPNALVELRVHDRETGAVTRMDLGENHDIYLARVAWSSDGRTLYAQRQSRDQRRLDLLAFDPATGRGHVILTEQSDAWISLTDDFRPLRDGNFLWSSEKDGHRHLYLHGPDGALLRQLTRGNWPVFQIEGTDEERGVVIFTASKDTPIERRLYEVSYRSPGEAVALTPGGGWWSATVAKTRGVFAGTYSAPVTPPQAALYAADGRRIRWIEENRLDEKHPYWRFRDGLGHVQRGVVRSVDGHDLHYSLHQPADFDPRRKYPVIVVVYGGPGVQRVTRSWGSPSDQVLVDAGYLVFKLDNRGMANRSVAFQTALRGGLGTVEVEDQLAGVAFLRTLPYIDSARLGVMGWSYGGLMTLLLLTEPNSPFVAGAAGAPPTDWALYDTHYTERYMGTPAANAAAYARADVLTRLDALQPGALLLMHGMADDNVILENSSRLMAALQARSLPFEVMLYPGERHGITSTRQKSRHLLQTQLDFFDRRLKRALPSASPAR